MQSQQITWTLSLSRLWSGAADSTFQFSGSLKKTMPSEAVLQLAVVKPNPDKTVENTTIQSSQFPEKTTYASDGPAGPAPKTTACKNTAANGS